MRVGGSLLEVESLYTPQITRITRILFLDFILHFTDSRAIVRLRDRNHQSSIIIYTPQITQITRILFLILFLISQIPEL